MLKREPDFISGKPDGYYLLSSKIGSDNRVSLVYVFDCPDFGGIRHVAFSPHDGAGIVPLWDLRSDCIMTPASITVSDSLPTTSDDLDRITTPDPAGNEPAEARASA